MAPCGWGLAGGDVRQGAESPPPRDRRGMLITVSDITARAGADMGIGRHLLADFSSADPTDVREPPELPNLPPTRRLSPECHHQEPATTLCPFQRLRMADPQTAPRTDTPPAPSSMTRSCGALAPASHSPGRPEREPHRSEFSWPSTPLPARAASTSSASWSNVVGRWMRTRPIFACVSAASGRKGCCGF